MPDTMPKVEEEIEKICKKLAPDNELLRFQLDFHLHAFAYMVVKEYMKMMADEEPYKPEDVRHG
jgi:hypothetical protein